MTDLHSRLLAELMKPDRFVTSSLLKVSEMAEKSASHRLASILRMIAEDEGLRERIAQIIYNASGARESYNHVKLRREVEGKEFPAPHMWPAFTASAAALSVLLSILPEEK